MSGHGFAGDDLRPLGTGQLAVFGEGDCIVIRAGQQQDSRSPNLELFILGGAPIKEPVAWMGPFVMNTKREVLQAFEDFQKGLLGSIPAIYKGDAKKDAKQAGQLKQPLKRTDKLSGDIKAVDIFNVHNAPADYQEGN